MIKKNRKWIIGILAFCLIWCVSVPVSVFALSPTLHLNKASIFTNNGNAYINNSTWYNVYLIDLNNLRSGTITLSFNSSTFAGTILFSSNDYPEDVVLGYYFKSSDFIYFSNSNISSYNFNDIRYIYIGTNNTFSYSINYSDPDPTPTNTPTPTPTDTPTPTPTHTPTNTPSPEPTDPINPPIPSNTPTPIPTGSGGYGIPLEYLVPFDYYMIAIVILLGGILICQLFKN